MSEELSKELTRLKIPSERKSEILSEVHTFHTAASNTVHISISTPIGKLSLDLG